MAGFGRTGKMWGVDHDGVVPDIMSVSKNTGGGIPSGAVLTRAEIAGTFHTSAAPTFAGNALACAAGLAATSVIVEQKLWENAAAMGRRLVDGLLAMKSARYVGEARFKGLIGRLELVKDRATKEPLGKKEMARVKEELLKRGAMVTYSGPKGNVFRIQPALVITAEQIDHVVGAFDQACRRSSADPAGRRSQCSTWRSTSGPRACAPAWSIRPAGCWARRARATPPTTRTPTGPNKTPMTGGRRRGVRCRRRWPTPASLPAQIDAIGLDAFASTLVVADDDGRPLRPAILWMDGARTEQAAAIEASGDPVLRFGGGQESVEWMLPRLLWLKQHEPEACPPRPLDGRSRRLVHPPADGRMDAVAVRRHRPVALRSLAGRLADVAA